MVKRQCLAALTAGLILSGPVVGHAKLRTSVPAADAQLSSAPKSLSLTFNEKVQLAVLTVSTQGKSIALTVDRNAAAAAQVTVLLPALAAGIYQVHWSALSVDDGHVSKGAFSFTLSAANP
jgi:copper resistance protein C